MTKAPILIAAVLLAQAAAAQETCTFDTRCVEAEACAPTDHVVTIDGERLITPGGTISVTTGGSATVGVFVGYDAAAFHVLTRRREGPARYAQHRFTDIVATTYLGSCTAP
ncbi:MAG: hypothetical protein ACU0BF_04915 [Paracoccaceae bacterium]